MTTIQKIKQSIMQSGLQKRCREALKTRKNSTPLKVKRRWFHRLIKKVNNQSPRGKAFQRLLSIEADRYFSQLGDL